MADDPQDEKTLLEAAWAAPIFNPLQITRWTTQRPLRGRCVHWATFIWVSVGAAWDYSGLSWQWDDNSASLAADPAEPFGIDPAPGQGSAE